MTYLGDFSFGSTVHFKFTTVGSSGAPAALSSAAVTCYRDGSTVQDTTGISLTSSFDTITGLNHVQIDLSTAGFYSSAGTYQAVLSSGGVASADLAGYVLAHFSIEDRSALTSTAGLETVSTAGLETLSSAGLETVSTAGLETATGFSTHSTAGLETLSSAGLETLSSAGLETATGFSTHSTAGLETVSTAGLETLSSAGLETISTVGLETATGFSTHSTAGLETLSSAGLETVSTAGLETATGFSTHSTAGLETATGFSTHSTAGLETASSLVTVANLTTGAAVEVNAEVLDVVNTDVFALPTGLPSTTPTMTDALGHVVGTLFRQIKVSASGKTFYDHAGNVSWVKGLQDDGSTYVELLGSTST